MHSQQMFNECIAETGEQFSFPDHPAVLRASTGGREGGLEVSSPPTLLISTYFPAADSEKEEHHIALLLLLKLLDVLEGTHFG